MTLSENYCSEYRFPRLPAGVCVVSIKKLDVHQRLLGWGEFFRTLSARVMPRIASVGDSKPVVGGQKQREAKGSPTQVSLAELIALQQQVFGLKLASVGAAKAAMAGAHGSRFRGRGMDYQESRAYQAGDDVRHMDWRVTARAGRPHVKVYEEERERPVVILLDMGFSMFFGTQGSFKSVQAARVAAFLAWAAVGQGDKIGALIFNRKHVELQPRGGTRAALHVMKALVESTDPAIGMQHEKNSPDALTEALKRLRRVARPGSLIFVLSDFYALDDHATKQLARLRLHNDVVAIQFSDVLEREPPPVGRYLVSDGQRAEVLNTQSLAALKQYRSWANKQQASLKSALRKSRIPLLQVKTTDDVVSVVRSWFSAASPVRGAAVVKEPN